MSQLSSAKFAVLCFLLLIGFSPAGAQTTGGGQANVKSETAPVPAGADDDRERIRQLELQVKTMMAQIEALKNEVERQSAAATKNGVAQPVNPAPEAKTTVAATKTETVKPETSPQTKSTGFALGPVRVTPYGTIYFNAFTDRGGTNNMDVPLFATPGGQGGTSASVRQTRLGLRFEGARVGRANLSGVIEGDFFGGFPAVPIGENFGVVRLRLANVRLDWERTSVTLGQDWMPFAPVNPNSLAAAAIPQLAAAGNNWARMPQVRVDYKLGKRLTLTGAVLAPQTGDSTGVAAFFLLPNSGAASRTPFFQTRLAYTQNKWFGTEKPGSLGFSTHYGRSRVLTGAQNVRNEIDSVGFAADWSFPLHRRLSLAGEAFTGRNLAGFQGGVFQSFVPDFAYRNGNLLTPGGVRAIGTRGGWVQLGFTPPLLGDRLTFFGSAGIDDPRDADLTSLARTNYRTQNAAFAVNFLYKITPQFSLGTEYRHFNTHYLFGSRRTAEHLNFSGAYSF